MITPYQQDKRWSDRFLPEIKSILGQHLIGAASLEEDRKRNTDLIVLKMEAVRIACRVRKYEYYVRYPDEFTIRASRPSKQKTELTKIVEGWGRFFFYGFADEHEQRLYAWSLCDLNVFRIWFQRYLAAHGGKTPGEFKSNHDGSSSFGVFHLDDLPNEFVRAQKGVA